MVLCYILYTKLKVILKPIIITRGWESVFKYKKIIFISKTINLINFNNNI